MYPTDSKTLVVWRHDGDADVKISPTGRRESALVVVVVVVEDFREKKIDRVFFSTLDTPGVVDVGSHRTRFDFF